MSVASVSAPLCQECSTLPCYLVHTSQMVDQHMAAPCHCWLCHFEAALQHLHSWQRECGSTWSLGWFFLLFRPSFDLKEGLWCTECFWEPQSFPTQVSVQLGNKYKASRKSIPKSLTIKKIFEIKKKIQQPGPGMHTKTTTTNTS